MADVATDVFTLVEAIVHVRHANVVHVHAGPLLHSLAFHVRTKLIRIVHDVSVGYVLSVYAAATLDHWQLLGAVQVFIRVGREATADRLFLVGFVEAASRQVRQFLLHLFEFVFVFILVV